MLVALGLASSSDDNSKIFSICGILGSVVLVCVALPTAWVDNSKESVLLEYLMMVAMC